MLGKLPFSLVLLALSIPAKAMYYIYATNSSITYAGPHSKWSLVDSRTDSWVNSSVVPSDALMHSVCVTADNCYVQIPFTGSGITIYNVIRSSINITITIDGGTPTPYSFVDDDSCLNTTSSGCFNRPIYSVQSFASGDHAVVIVISSVPPSARNLPYSDFCFDHAIVNETSVAISSPTTVFLPSPTDSSNPTSSPNPTISSTNSVSGTPTPTTHTNGNVPHRHPHFGPGIISAFVIGLVAVFTFVFVFIFCPLRRYWEAWGQPKPEGEIHDPESSLQSHEMTSTANNLAGTAGGGISTTHPVDPQQ